MNPMRRIPHTANGSQGASVKAARRAYRVRDLRSRDTRVLVRALVTPSDGGAKPHPGPDFLPKQPQIARKSQSFRQTLQHGTGEREGDVVGDTKVERWEERQASQQGSLHQQDVFERRLCHSGAAELNCWHD